MKTETSMTNRPPAATGKPVLEQLRASSVAAARGMAKGQSANLSFQALFADIQPKADLFRDMTQKLAERRAEQGRLERERDRSRPRAEDMQAAPALTPPRQPEPHRTARSGDTRAQAPARSEPVRTRSADAQPSRQTDVSRRTGASGQQPAAASAPAQNTPSARGGSARTATSGSDEAQETRQGTVQQAAGMGRPDEAAQTGKAGSAGSMAGTGDAQTASGTTTATAGKAGDREAADGAAAQTANRPQAAEHAAAQRTGTARAGQPAGDMSASSASASAPAGAGAAGQALPAGVTVTTVSTTMDSGSGSDATADAPIDETALQQLAQDMARVNGADAETLATGQQALAQDDTAAATAVPADADAADAMAGELAGTAAAASPSSRRGAAATASAGTGTQAGRGKVDMAGAGTGMPATARSATATSSTDTGASSGQEDRAAAGAQTAALTGSTPDTPLAAGPVRAEGTPFSLGLATPAAPAHSPSRVDGSPLLSSRIDSPVHSEEFKEQFARQVAGVVVQGQDRAEIRLTPAELGPIRIRIALNAEEAALDISAAHAATRAAIESSVHTLRQMLADHGLRLADYRMDQGLMSQQRQPGQDGAAGAQQFGAAFGQGNGQGGNGRGAPDAHSTGHDMAATGSGPAAVSDSTSGSRRGGNTATDSRLDLFA